MRVRAKKTQESSVDYKCKYFSKRSEAVCCWKTNNMVFLIMSRFVVFGAFARLVLACCLKAVSPEAELPPLRSPSEK